MRRIKPLGLVVVAALVLTALAGSGTASATTLCKEALEPNSECPEPDRVSRRPFLLVSNLRDIAQLDPLGNV
jgi:hypothetical protein